MSAFLLLNDQHNKILITSEYLNVESFALLVVEDKLYSKYNNVNKHLGLAILSFNSNGGPNLVLSLKG